MTIQNKEKGNNKSVPNFIIDHSHSHSLEGVVKALYNAPESFSITKEEEVFYSKQELAYLQRIKKYLLLIGMKDVETIKVPISRFRNKRHAKYENALIYKVNDAILKEILKNKIDFLVFHQFEKYQALIVDKLDNFKLFIEFTHEETKLYKDIKNIYPTDKLKDSDKILVRYFKVLEIF